MNWTNINPVADPGGASPHYGPNLFKFFAVVEKFGGILDPPLETDLFFSKKPEFPTQFANKLYRNILSQTQPWFQEVLKSSIICADGFT